jgi:DNA-binding MarR family transcriptional regulator
MTSPRPDLGASLHALTRAVLAREVPVLHAHEVEMWEYVVLGGLESGPAPTQSQLAVAVGRDKTRLIPILDGLEARGLLLRTPDPADRRNRVVALTDAGRSLLTACRASVRTLEDELLADLAPRERATFRNALERLAGGVGARDGDG